MAIRINVLSFLVFLVSTLEAKSQTRDIVSLNGESNRIYYEIDYTKNLLSISTELDTLWIYDVIQLIDTPKVICGKFLKIEYNIRGGTGVRYGRQLIMCIKNKRLIEAFHITSMYKVLLNKTYTNDQDSDELFEKRIFYTTTTLIGHKVPNYKLKVSLHNESTSKEDLSENYNYNFVYELKFDSEKGIFCTGTQQIANSLTFLGTNSIKDSTSFIKGNFPYTKIDKVIYYYLDDIWYEMDSYKYLIPYSTRIQLKTKAKVFIKY